MRYLALAALPAICIAAPAGARTVFYAYDGPAAVRTGNGGTKTVTNGVEFWVQGDPAREYRLLGKIVDTRMAGDGDAIGSKAVARAIRKAGGDSALVVTQQQADGGVIAGGTPSHQYAVPIGWVTTYFDVIAYTANK